MAIEAKTLLIFEAGLRSGREYWLLDLKSAGYKLVLTQPWPLDWEQPYIDSYLQCRLNPWTSEERRKITTFARNHSVSGVICLNEGTVPFANDVNDDLGLAKICLDDIGLLRNKIDMRNKLAATEILQPEYFAIREHDPIDQLTIDFPAVVKPTQMMSSLGVKLVKNKSEAIQAILDARKVDFDGENLREHYGFKRDVIVEGYVGGDEYSFETFVQNGKIIDFFITKKFKGLVPRPVEIRRLSGDLFHATSSIC